MNFLIKLWLPLCLLCLGTSATATESEPTQPVEIKYIDPQGVNGISHVKLFCKIKSEDIKDCPLSVKQYLWWFIGKNPEAAFLPSENTPVESLDKPTNYHAFIQFKILAGPGTAESCKIEEGLNDHNKPTHLIIYFPEKEKKGSILCELKRME